MEQQQNRPSVKEDALQGEEVEVPPSQPGTATPSRDQAFLAWRLAFLAVPISLCQLPSSSLAFQQRRQDRQEGEKLSWPFTPLSRSNLPRPRGAEGLTWTLKAASGVQGSLPTLSSSPPISIPIVWVWCPFSSGCKAWGVSLRIRYLSALGNLVPEAGAFLDLGGWLSAGMPSEWNLLRKGNPRSLPC